MSRNRQLGRERGWLLSLFIMIGILLGGCGQKEVSKTVVLPKETEEDGNESGINIKNIQEHAYEGYTKSLTWKKGNPGEICVFLESGMVQTIDVYRRETIETVMNDFFVGIAKIAPGGSYIIYEVMNDSSVQLVLYRTETGEKQVIREWEDSSETYIYAWSGDGTKFFAWQDGNNYGQDLYGSWSICRYDAKSGEKTEMLMEGNGGAWRTVFPSEDGSKAYVREEYMDENGNMIMDESGGMQESYGIVDEYPEFHVSENEESVADRSWVIDMGTGEAIELGEAGVSNPIRYTRQGVFSREGDEVWLLPEPLGETEKRRILTTDCKEISICENGDHIFLMDWDMEQDYLQVTGVRMQDGEVAGRQILYKNIYGICDAMLVGQEDSELIIQTEEYLSKGDYLMKVVVLEY